MMMRRAKMGRHLVIAFVIFTAAFVVGVGCVFVIQHDFFPEEEMATIADSVSAVEEPKPEWMRDPLIGQTWPLCIEYQCNLRIGGNVKAVFKLTNVSSKTAFLAPDPRNGKLPSLLSNASPWSKSVLSRIETTDLLPQESTLLYVPISDDVEYFDLSFVVNSGYPPRPSRAIWTLYSPQTAQMCGEPPDAQ
jgi:hypothetical protein